MFTIFIERDSTTVTLIHCQLTDINILKQLKKFGNGFYKIIK